MNFQKVSITEQKQDPDWRALLSPFRIEWFPYVKL